MPLLPRGERADRGSARSVRRSHALRLSPPAADGVEIARRAAELVERAPDPKRFWEEHIKLMTRSETLTEDDLKAVARDLGVPVDCGPPENPAVIRAKTRVDADEASAAASGALITPPFSSMAAATRGLGRERAC
jgi:hypothetical protein